MNHTLCLIGLNKDDEQRFHAVLAQAGNGRWQVAPEAAAEVLVVDLDSMVGQMSWLKLARGGRKVVALSVRPNGETGLTLQRPLSTEALAEVLQRLESELPAAAPAKPGAEAATAPVQPKAAAAPLRPQAAEAPAAVQPPRLVDYLSPEALPGPVRLQVEGAPPLVIDPDNNLYLGGDKLKPYAAYCTRPIAPDDWQSLDQSELPALEVKLGGRQPLLRLRWLSALLAGEGKLLPPWSAEDRFKLNRWPQIEREFPKHFRIATAMMKGSATLAEIAELSQSPQADVADFINASLATGVAEPVR